MELIMLQLLRLNMTLRPLILHVEHRWRRPAALPAAGYLLLIMSAYNIKTPSGLGGTAPTLSVTGIKVNSR